jgi:hypothetical protein
MMFFNGASEFDSLIFGTVSIEELQTGGSLDVMSAYLYDKHVLYWIICSS